MEINLFSRLRPPRLLRELPVILGATFLAIVIVYAWSDPTQAPPNGNVLPPVRLGPSAAQTDTSANNSIFINDTGGGDLLRLSNAGGDRFAVTASGNIGIGTTVPSYKLDVADGGIRVQDFTTSGGQNLVVGDDMYLSDVDSPNTLGFYGTTSDQGHIRLGSAGPLISGVGGNLGIGDATPLSPLTVGEGDLFRVDSSGNLIRINNVAYSWPSTGAAGVLTNDGSGALSWAAAPPASGSPGESVFYTTDACPAGWTDGGTYNSFAPLLGSHNPCYRTDQTCQVFYTTDACPAGWTDGGTYTSFFDLFLGGHNPCYRCN